MDEFNIKLIYCLKIQFTFNRNANNEVIIHCHFLFYNQDEIEQIYLSVQILNEYEKEIKCYKIERIGSFFAGDRVKFFDGLILLYI